MDNLERKLLKIVRGSPQGIGLKELTSMSGYSFKPVQKACKRLDSQKLIRYPIQKKRGQKISITPIFNREIIFKKFPDAKFIKKISIGTSLVIRLINSQTICGIIDDMSSDKKSVILFDTWNYDSNEGWNSFMNFLEIPLKNIRSFYLTKKATHIDNVLDLWENPNLQFPKGIICNRSTTGNHSKECDSELHSALSIIYTRAAETTSSASEARHVVLLFRKILRHIIQNGGKIPYDV